MTLPDGSLLENPEVSQLSGPVLRDTARLCQRYPPIARYGVVGVTTWPLGRTPSPCSERFPLGEHAKRRCDTPLPQKGHLSDACAIPYENKAKRVRCPPLRYYLERVLRDMGRYSHSATRGFIRLHTTAGDNLASFVVFCWETLTSTDSVLAKLEFL